LWSCRGRKRGGVTEGRRRPSRPGRKFTGPDRLSRPIGRPAEQDWVKVLEKWPEGELYTGLLLWVPGDPYGDLGGLDSLGAYWPEARLWGPPKLEGCGRGPRYWYRWRDRLFGPREAARLWRGEWTTEVHPAWARGRYMLLVLGQTFPEKVSEDDGCELGLLDMESGRLVKRWPVATRSGCLGVNMALVPGRPLLVAEKSERLSLMDLRSGKTVWQAHVSEDRHLVGSIWVHGELILIGMSCGARSAWSLQTGRRVWLREGRASHKNTSGEPSCEAGPGEELDAPLGRYYDRKTGRVTRRWKDAKGRTLGGFFSSSMCVGHEVYRDGEWGKELVLERADAKTGKILWRKSLRPKDRHGTLLVAQDVVLDVFSVRKEEGGWKEVEITAVDRRTGKEVWRRTVDVRRWKMTGFALEMGIDWHGKEIQIWTTEGNCARLVFPQEKVAGGRKNTGWVFMGGRNSGARDGQRR